MTRKRMVGPRSDGDFAMSIGMGGGRRRGASIIKKARKETAKPESSMKTKKKATRTRSQLKRLAEKLDQAHSNQILKDQRKSSTPELEKSPDSTERVNIQVKGGLREDVKAFKKKLERDDTYKGDAVRAYKDLHFSKYKAGKPKKEQKRLSKNLSSILKGTFGYRYGRVGKKAIKDPMVRKVIRKTKKLAKEEFKKQIKKYEESK